MHTCRLVLLLYSIIHIDAIPLTVDYLEQLINSAVKQAETYRVRQNNNEFYRHFSNQAAIQDYGVFDFIIVGAGSSGSVIASRLSEIKQWKILLLEAGGLDDDLSDIPNMYKLLQSSDRNWGYFTTSQKKGCFGWKENKCQYVRGKVLGGSGTINGLAYVRGNKNDYDNWEKLGNDGWSFENLLPYFKRIENFEADDRDIKYRGYGGNVNVAYKKPKQALTRDLLAASEIGLKLIEDYNAEHQIGFSRNQRNIKFGKRVSGSTAYLKPAMQRRNFNLTLDALVIEISIDEFNKAANGLLFMKDGIKYRARTKYEIIISGGAVNSPQLLMLSGVGPSDELLKHEIKPITLLPVGQYLRDHTNFEINFKTNRTLAQKSLRELLEEYIHGRGMLTNQDNTISYLFLNSKNLSSPTPNIELVHSDNVFESIPRPKIRNYIKVVEDYQQVSESQTHFQLKIAILHQKSMGALKLKSRDPKDFPLIDSGIFSHHEDFDVMYEGIKIATKFADLIAKDSDVKRINMTFCNQYQDNSREYWYCAMKHLAFPGNHISSTVKMGPKTDSQAVVDIHLKVYGIKNLRVADCSIMPTPVSGHNNAIAFVIGEKAGDMIKEDYGFRPHNH